MKKMMWLRFLIIVCVSLLHGWPAFAVSNDEYQCNAWQCNLNIKVDEPGFYVLKVRPLEGAREGAWSMNARVWDSRHDEL
ncbi:MAG: hypothetical protein GY859_33785, partial [Desulfobacterales bacterium]|nr:hypothetical protein [Desulfobacterales bacterium]